MGNLFDLIEDRKKYPIGFTGCSESDYISQHINPSNEKQYLILPQSFLNSGKGNDREIKQVLFDDWKLLAIFDLGAIWSPFCNLRFSLIILVKESPLFTFFSEYLKKTFKSNSKDLKHSGLIGEQEPYPEYVSYIEFIEKETFSNFEREDKADFRLWSIPYSDVDLKRLQLNYHDPELQEDEVKFDGVSTESLDLLVKILRPKKITQSMVKVIKTKDCKYPFNIEALEEGYETDTVLQSGDIIISHNGEKVFLFSTEVNQKIYASEFLKILRLKSDCINPEYLFLYLQSTVGQKYFKKHLKGSTIGMLSIEDLRKLPIILPSLEIQENSKSFFNIEFLSIRENNLDKIDEYIFAKPNLGTDFEKKLFQEFKQSLQGQKKKVFETIILKDMNELKQAKKNKMFKAFYALAGSILEAFLLEWYSEKENKDCSNLDLKLNKLINEIFQESHLSSLCNDAHYIREKRNTIHPKRALQDKEMPTEADCEKVIAILSEIFKARSWVLNPLID
jgi:hypothetical protein